MNIALSQTKYQYSSGARGTLDLIELPSHFAELYLTDYDFVKQFSLVPISKPGTNEIEMQPIHNSVF